jgi:uncharacterized coiled-coil DUF342 family protein
VLTFYPPVPTLSQDDVAVELAQLEGLRALVPHLEQQVEQTTGTVQQKNQRLRERMRERAQLQQELEALSGVDALGACAADAAPPYSAEVLHELTREYAEVQRLQKEVLDAGQAYAEEAQTIGREIATAQSDTSHIKVEQDALHRQLEAVRARTSAPLRSARLRAKGSLRHCCRCRA